MNISESAQIDFDNKLSTLLENIESIDVERELQSLLTSNHTENYYEWDPSLSLNIESIDKQHKMMVKQLNTVTKLSKSNTPISLNDVQSIINFMLDYAQFHLRYEEALMKEANYPDYQTHKEKHHLFELHATKYIQELSTHTPNEILHEIANYLLNWVKVHIKKEDKAFAPYLITKGIGK